MTTVAITIKSLTQFCKEASRQPRTAAGDTLTLFRGQEDFSWACIPGIARKPLFRPAAIFKRRDQLPRPAEYRLFVLFRDQTIPYQPLWVHAPTSEEEGWRQLVLAQHYGLPTRLLDWSRFPLVALFFACWKEEYRHLDGAVFAVSVDRKTVFTVPALAAHNPDPPLYRYKRKVVGFFIPPDIDRRVTVQGSVLAIRHDPTLPVVANPQFRVPAGKKKMLLDDLKRLGITYGSLFPDLAGVATTLKDEVGDWHPGLR
jgi:hypothetical protein